MTKNFFAAMLLFSTLYVLSSDVYAEDVIILESADGAESEYETEQLLRVELMGDSIRFIDKDGTIAAQVYKYDYTQLTIEEKEPVAVKEPATDTPKPVAKKVLINGRIYITFGDTGKSILCRLC
ncbi:MAG: hypothetical protein IJP50_04240 [Paludibacteraceae bacterium]|nr:hypothetical protein [Paludibacteraceae bacterium]